MKAMKNHLHQQLPRREDNKSSLQLKWVALASDNKRRSNSMRRSRRLSELPFEARSKHDCRIPEPRIGWVVNSLMQSRVREMVRTDHVMCCKLLLFVLWYKSHFCLGNEHAVISLVLFFMFQTIFVTWLSNACLIALRPLDTPPLCSLSTLPTTEDGKPRCTKHPLRRKTDTEDTDCAMLNRT